MSISVTTSVVQTNNRFSATCVLLARQVNFVCDLVYTCVACTQACTYMLLLYMYVNDSLLAQQIILSVISYILDVYVLYMHLIFFQYSRTLIIQKPMVQLKGNLTYVDRAHATYWLNAHGLINPYWHVRERKPAKIKF